MSAEQVRVRRRHAESYLAAADLVVDLSDDADIDTVANVVGSLAVLAGIAATDSICGRALGIRSASESHFDAIELLSQVAGVRLAPTLKRLLQGKTDTQYSPLLLSPSKSRDMLDWARRLVVEAARTTA
ncbi:MAG: hypothetical protein ABI632_13295 [Pseudolysinimonas sp.]